MSFAPGWPPGGLALLRLVRMVRTGQLDVAEFITHQFPLAGTEEAYDVFSRPGGALKVALVRS